MNIDDDTIYGVEFYSQDHMKPGFMLTFTGKEIKEFIKKVNKQIGKDAIRTFTTGRE